MAKPLHPASNYELEATDLLGMVMRNGKKRDKLFAAAVLVLAAAIRNGNGKNGNGAPV